ncbi:MAG: hypothetical protein EYC70_02835 [Planctomycetota bacterium]|nr:MAG: hypothetical protein EYC70_02835 [Planctomycetota bacterium]
MQLRSLLTLLALPLVVGLALSSTCVVGVCNCEDDKDEVRHRLGPPDEVQVMADGALRTDLWFYWCQGRAYSFTSGDDFDDCCDIDATRFTPACPTEVRASLATLPPPQLRAQGAAALSLWRAALPGSAPLLDGLLLGTSLLAAASCKERAFAALARRSRVEAAVELRRYREHLVQVEAALRRPQPPRQTD